MGCKKEQTPNSKQGKISKIQGNPLAAFSGSID
jgi:hypothetical protein